MKILPCLFIVFILLSSALCMAAEMSPARVTNLEGDVMFRTQESNEWLPVSVNTPLDDGDALWTPSGSRCDIQLADGTVLRSASNTQLDIVAIENGYSHFHVASGTLYVRTSPRSPSNALQIDADDTTVLPDARTRLRIDMLANDQEDVTIIKGSAYVEGNGSRTKVRAGEHLALEDGHNELLPLNPRDSFDLWNIERDRLMSRAAKADSYLPEELQHYTGEFDSNGQWVRSTEYGMVWRPTVIGSGDWAPYRSGRWIWKNNDYVWIAYEQWGWVPYHYGRWTVIGSYGWCWIPPSRDDIFWGPGYVGWYGDNRHVGWTPLAPGEMYYGRRHYGRHSAVIASAPVSTASITYKNRNFQSGFTLVLHNDFQRGAIRLVQPTSSTSVSLSVTAGSPHIRPTRESRMPVVKNLPPRVAPPSVSYREKRELRNKFPRITIQEARPERPSASATIKDRRDSVPPPPTSAQGKRQDKEYRQEKSQQDKLRAAPLKNDQSRVEQDGNNKKESRQRKQWRVVTHEKGADKEPKDKENNRDSRGNK